ncbi:MAG: EAL domain-containing protein, partial [Arcobacteraceae bacterium]
GLIVQIGEWVLQEACKQAAIWNNEGKNIVVAVNISAVQFKRGNLVEVVKKALKVSGLNPKYLELELTESILISDTESVLNTVKVIKEMGVLLSIDDFGTGYSSLSYLKRFAVDKLKIDQSFVRDIIKDKDDATIVKTIIQMAKSFNLKAIAEGVENEAVLSMLHEFGCDEVQGYYFAKPMIAYEFEHYYEQRIN